MTEQNLIEKLEAKAKKAVDMGNTERAAAFLDAINDIRDAQPCTDQDAVAKETKEAETLLSDSVSKETLPSEIRVPTDEYIFMILANETLSLSEQLDLLRPYLRTTEPVSLKQCAQAMRETRVLSSGGDAHEVMAKAVLDAAGVAYVD